MYAQFVLFFGTTETYRSNNNIMQTCFYQYLHCGINYFAVVGNVVPSNCTDGDLRLAGGSADYEGRVETCVNRAWGTVCSQSSPYYHYYYSNWQQTDAMVVCRQLGHQELGRFIIILLLNAWLYVV